MQMSRTREGFRTYVEVKEVTDCQCPYVSQTRASIVEGWIQAGLAAVTSTVPE